MAAPTSHLNLPAGSLSDSSGYRGATSRGYGGSIATAANSKANVGGSLVPANFDPAIVGGNPLDSSIADAPKTPGETVSQQMAQWDATSDLVSSYNKYNYEVNDETDPLAKVALGLSLAGISAGAGAIIAPAVAGAIGGVGGSIAGGAAAGGTTGAIGSALTGTNVGKGALIGAIGGGITGGIQGSGVLGNAKSGLSSLGVPNGVSGALVNGGAKLAATSLTGLAAGAITGNGQNGNQPNATPAATATPASGIQAQSGAQVMGANPGLTYNPGGGSAVRMAADPGLTYNPGGGTTPSGSNGSSYLGAGTLAAGLGAGALASGIQGNNGNMASTDSSLASTITGALPGVLQAGIGTAGSLAAANAESNADQNAITTQQNNLGNINNIWATQQQTGQGANTALQSSLGLNGQTANPSNFLNMPGYQFAVQQGTQAIQRQAASMGNAYTPNTAAAVGQYVTGTASQDYNTYISQLMGAAGLGTTANQGLQTGNQTTANNIGQLQQNIGVAQGEGYTGVANSAGSLFGANGAGTSLINAAGRALGGGSGGGSSGGGMTANSGDTTSGGVDPSTGVPYDLEGSGQGSAGSLSTYDANNPLGGAYGSTSLNSGTGNWSSVTDSTFNGSGDTAWNPITDSGGGDGTSVIGSFFGGGN
jgi:hypothetical protein